MTIIKLKKNRQRSLERKHPWVFSGAIDSIKDPSKNGETVKVVSVDGKFLGWGAYSLKSQISVRIWSFDENEKIDSEFFKRQIEQAIELRTQIVDTTNSNAYRNVPSVHRNRRQRVRQAPLSILRQTVPEQSQT